MSETLQIFATDRHTFAERAMSELGISWSVQCVNVTDVDVEDNTWQTRLDVAHCRAEVSREYADKIKCGEAFPMVVLQKKSPDKYRVVCGRHRVAAYAIAQNGKTSFRAYVVDQETEGSLLVALSAKDNNANGIRQSSAETAQVAADWLARLPLPRGVRQHKHIVIRDVSQQFGANDKTVADHYFGKLVAKEMLAVGVPPDGINVTIRRSLWKWTENAEWSAIARAVSNNRSASHLGKIIKQSTSEKVDAKVLIERINEAGKAGGHEYAGRCPVKDPATVTLEHLSLALRDLRDLAAPRNLCGELAEDIVSTVEAVRLACKEWQSR